MAEQLTVKQLIERLQQYPPDAKVNLCYDSDYTFTSCCGSEQCEDGEVYLLSKSLNGEETS